MSDSTEVVLETPLAVEENTGEQLPVTEQTEDTEKPSETLAEKTFTQAELDEIVQKRITKLERKLEKQRIETETRAQVMREVQSQPEKVADKPKVEDFTDYGDYQEALTDWKVEQKLAEIESKKAIESQKKAQQTESERFNSRSQEIIEEGSKRYDDFDEMPEKTAAHLKSKGLQLSVEFVKTLAESDSAPDIVAHMYQNPAEAERIAALTPYAQAKEIGKLEDKLSAKKPIQTSKAPKPIDPIGGNKSSVKSVEDMSLAEYTAMRAKQGAKWAR